MDLWELSEPNMSSSYMIASAFAVQAGVAALN